MASQVQPLRERDPNATPAAAPPSKGTEAILLTNPPSQSTKATSKQTKKTTPSTNDDKKPLSAADLSHIHLDGEEEQQVRIFDTCDDIRKKINDHLKAPTNQSAFCRELTELMPHETVQQRQLANFLKFKGPRAGAHNPAFYAGYVYFEKLRLHQGKKKSTKREKLEEAWRAEGGFPREGSHNMRLICAAGENWKLDYLGQIQITGAPNMSSGKISRKKLRT